MHSPLCQPQRSQTIDSSASATASSTRPSRRSRIRRTEVACESNYCKRRDRARVSVAVDCYGATTFCVLTAQTLCQQPPRLSPRSLENLKNVKGVTWSHGPSMESPCLEAEAKNHSSPRLRLLLKRFWNRLSYLRSTHLSGTPSNTTNVLLMPAESYKPIRRTRSARNGTARLSLASEKQSGTRACPTRTPPSHSYQVKAG